ncbi:MAG: SEC-C domain-containing protein [Planctomycetes bacterium]|nr:SEC-C domain-containing protein [Planctomycetota bacterium]
MDKTNRNDPCPCGSGRKYKRCCLKKTTSGNFEQSKAAQTSPATQDGKVQATLIQALNLIERHPAEGRSDELEQVVTDAYWDPMRGWLYSETLQSEQERMPNLEALHLHYLLDTRFTSGMSIAGDLRQKRGAYLDRKVVSMLEALDLAQFRIVQKLPMQLASGAPAFRIVFPTVPDDESVVQLDGFGQAESLLPGMTFALRYVTFGGSHRLIGQAFLLESSLIAPLIRHLATLSTQEFLRLAAPLIHATEFAGRCTPVPDFELLVGNPQPRFSVSLEPPNKKPTRERPTKQLILTRALTSQGGLVSYASAADRRKVFYEGRLALRYSQASAAGTPDPIQNLMPCRRRPGSRPCSGSLTAQVPVCEQGHRDETAMVWHCPNCGDAGILGRWRNTPFDANHTRTWTEPGPETWENQISLNLAEKNCLEKSAYLNALAFATLLRLRQDPSKPKAFHLRAPIPALAELARGLLVAYAYTSSPSKTLTALCKRLCKVSELPAHMDLTALATECIIHQQQSETPSSIPLDQDPSGPVQGLQISVFLMGHEPKIQRTLQVPSNRSLHDLHIAIQLAMGWSDNHLYIFSHKENRYGEIQKEPAPNQKDSRECPLWQVLKTPGDELQYEYDLGDSWLHKIQLLATTPTSTTLKLLSGSRACPPEDCGGLPGLENILKTLKHPLTDEYQDTINWLGGGYSPSHFDLAHHQALLTRLGQAWDQLP